MSNLGGYNRKEIEFRAKAVMTDTWVYGHYAFVDGYHIIYENNKPIIIHLHTLGQFVGATDSNKRRIYEGDLLEISDRVGIQVVYQDLEGCYGTEEFALYELIRDKGRTFKVVGNIHENSEI